jgi:hypothetical protein
LRRIGVSVTVGFAASVMMRDPERGGKLECKQVGREGWADRRGTITASSISGLLLFEFHQGRIAAMTLN